MRAVNLYSISREMDREVKPKFEQALSDRETPLRVRDEEIGQIRELSDIFDSLTADSYCYDDWFYSFSIPQIGKEFDLIKIGDDNVIVNVELKSQEVSLEKIKKQLLLNRHYFSHIAHDIYSFTFMKCEGKAKIYQYSGGKLEETDFSVLLEAVKLIKTAKHDGIENIFRPRDYLISPLNNPDKYLEGKYYLTNLQEMIKEKILDSFDRGRAMWGINGAAGTGKTLLLYDLVRKLSKTKRVCIVNSGPIGDGHKYIESHLNNVIVVAAKEVNKDYLQGCDIVCVDESQRLEADCLKNIIFKAYDEGLIDGCVFSYDEYQTLSEAEEKSDIRNLLKAHEAYREEHLTDRIRTNREVNWFIRNMLSLKDHAPLFFDFNNIDVVYANDEDEATRIVGFYEEKDYVFIDYSPNESVLKKVKAEGETLNSYTVIGQEFDNVVMVLDERFTYNNRGELAEADNYTAINSQGYRYLKMFYQNVTRAREKLCIVVKNNKDVFKELINILS